MRTLNTITVNSLSQTEKDAIEEVEWRDSSLQPLEDFTNLRVLRLRGMRSLEGVQALVQLEELHASGNSLVSVRQLKSLTNLKYLDLSRNSLYHLEDLEGLKALEYLDISFNNVSDLDFAKGLESLQVLKADANEITSVRPLKFCKELAELSVGKNHLDSLKGLEKLPLEELNICENCVVSLEPLKDMHTLQTLYAVKNRIRDCPQSLSRVQVLDLTLNPCSQVSKPQEDLQPISDATLERLLQSTPDEIFEEDTLTFLEFDS